MYVCKFVRSLILKSFFTIFLIKIGDFDWRKIKLQNSFNHDIQLLDLNPLKKGTFGKPCFVAKTNSVYRSLFQMGGWK